jgi:protein-tyrosine-phosphatase
MAEAILNAKGRGRFEAHSAGSHPAARVNPLAIDALRHAGIEWKGHAPQGMTGLERERWDFVITVCDNAREACPIFPGQPVLAHWGMEDPAEVDGTDEEKQRAFEQARLLITRRLSLLIELPLEKLEGLARAAKLQAIGKES